MFITRLLRCVTNLATKGRLDRDLSIMVLSPVVVILMSLCCPT